MSLRLLMISGDRQALKPGRVQRRLLALSEHVEVLHVVVPAPSHKQQIAPNAWVYGSGGSSRIGQWLASIKIGQRLSRQHVCNVVTAQDPFELGLAAYLIARRVPVRLHLQDHGAFLGNRLFRTISRRRGLQWRLGRWLVGRAAAIRTVSQRGRAGLLAAGVRPDKITVAPIGTDLSPYLPLAQERRYAPEVKTIVALGRLETEKGFDVLIESFAQVHQQDPRVRLLIAGDGSQRGSLLQLIKANGLVDAALIMGYQADTTELLTQADLFAVPSYAEGWGLAAIEAAASGLPIVMTDVGCAGEVLKDGESAVIVPPGVADALSRAIIKLLGDAQRREQLGRSAAAAVQRLPSPEAARAATVESYTKALYA